MAPFFRPARILALALMTVTAAPAAYAGDGAFAQLAAVRRGWLGVEMSTHPDNGSVVATRIIRSSPADSAGLKQGDTLLAVDGQTLTGPKQLIARVALLGPGKTVALTVERSGTRMDLMATLAPFPGEDEILRIDRIGAAAPAFQQLAAVSGKVPGKLDQLRGKVVLLDFWSTFCPACRMLSPQLNQLHSKLGNKGLSIVGLTSDPVPVATRTAKALSMRYAVASDPEDATARSYGVHALPTTFVIDKKGVIREVAVGFDPTKSDELEQLVVRLLAE